MAVLPIRDTVSSSLRHPISGTEWGSTARTRSISWPRVSPDPWIGQLVARSAALGDGDDESASAQASEVIRENLTRDPDLVGEVRRIPRGLPQAEQYLGSRRVREGVSES